MAPSADTAKEDIARAMNAVRGHAPSPAEEANMLAQQVPSVPQLRSLQVVSSTMCVRLQSKKTRAQLADAAGSGDTPLEQALMARNDQQAARFCKVPRFQNSKSQSECIAL